MSRRSSFVIENRDTVDHDRLQVRESAFNDKGRQESIKFAQNSWKVLHIWTIIVH